MAIDDKAERATKIIKVRVTPSQYESIKKYADKKGKVVSKIIRDLLMSLITETSIVAKKPRKTPKKPIEKAAKAVEFPRPQTKIRSRQVKPIEGDTYITDLPPEERKKFMTNLREELEKRRLDSEAKKEKEEEKKR